MDYHYHARTTMHQRKELAMAVIEGRMKLSRIRDLEPRTAVVR